MLNAAIGFFVLALLAYLFGANHIGGVSMEIGSMLLWVFLAFAIVSGIVALIRGRTPPKVP